MAACHLDVTHPRFIRSLERSGIDADTQEALKTIKEKVEADHASCNRVVQNFYGNKKYTHLHRKIWKYDWGASGASGRKSWRLVVVVLDPDKEPYELIAGAVYSKSMTAQLSFKELAKIFAQVTAPILATEEAPQPGSKLEFQRVPNGDGRSRSICMGCYAHVEISLDAGVLDDAEVKHVCPSGEDSN
jgi:hypothetical protein